MRLPNIIAAITAAAVIAFPTVASAALTVSCTQNPWDFERYDCQCSSSAHATAHNWTWSPLNGGSSFTFVSSPISESNVAAFMCKHKWVGWVKLTATHTSIPESASQSVLCGNPV